MLDENQKQEPTKDTLIFIHKKENVHFNDFMNKTFHNMYYFIIFKLY